MPRDQTKARSTASPSALCYVCPGNGSVLSLASQPNALVLNVPLGIALSFGRRPEADVETDLLLHGRVIHFTRVLGEAANGTVVEFQMVVQHCLLSSTVIALTGSPEP